MPCCLHPRICLIAASLFFLAVTAKVQASSSTVLNYTLVNGSNTTISRLDFKVIPSGAVTPPIVGTDPATGASVTGSPITLLSNSTGFDPSNFSVALGSKPDAQILRFLFGQAQTVDASGNVSFSPILDSNGNPIGGFQPEGILNFSVSVDSSTSSQFRLQLPSSIPGLTLNQLSVNVPVSIATSSLKSVSSATSAATLATLSTSQVPEPMSLVVWSALIVLGMTQSSRLRSLARTQA